MRLIDSWPFRRLANRPQVWMLVVTLLALLYRVWRLNDLPPALYLDEAWDGFDALRVLGTRTAYLFFGGSYGREPLMIHLQALCFLFLGSGAWSLRLVSALAGTMTVPALYRATAEVLGRTPRARWTGVVAATLLAVSFWHMEVSRISPRVILVPLFGCLAVWAFWRGWTRRERRAYIWAGVCIGVGLYSYPASRLVPVLLAGFALVAVVAGRLFSRLPRVGWRDAVLGIAIMGIVSGILFAPLGLYYAQNPGAFYVRSADTSILSPNAGEESGQIGQNLVRVVRLFIDRGDTNWRHNLSGRPAWDPVGLAGFWIGLVLAVVAIPVTPAALFVIGWLGLNLSPTALTTDAPHFLRAVNALPAACILAAGGLSWLWQRVAPRVGWAPLVLLVALVSGVPTWIAYFDIWGSHPETYRQFNGELYTIVEQAMRLSETSQVIVPLSVFGSPHMQYELARRYPQGLPMDTAHPSGPAWVLMDFAHRTNAVLGPRGIFVPEPLDDARLEKLSGWLQGGEAVKTRFDQTVANMRWLDTDADFVRPPAPAHTLDANYGGMVRLFGYSLNRTTLAPRDKMRVTLYWQALQDLNSDYYVSCNVLDPQGESLLQRVSEPVMGATPTSFWRRGLVMVDDFEIQIPKSAHDGNYQIELSLLDRKKADLLVPPMGAHDRLVLTSFLVARTPVVPEQVAHPVQITFGEPAAISLFGYDLDRRGTGGGEGQLTLFWRAGRMLPTDLSVFVHLLDAGGEMIAQQDGPPQEGNAPTSWWNAGDLIRDTRTIAWPAEPACRPCRLDIGLYDPATGQRLPVFDSHHTQQTDDQWVLPAEFAAP